MSYSIKQVAVASLTFLLGFFSLLAAASAEPTENAQHIQGNSATKNTATASSSESDRVIIVYPLNGCDSLMSESVSYSESQSGLELQSPRRARDIALSELGRRVNEFRNQRFGFQGSEHRNLAPEARPSTSLESSKPASMKLTTQYLNAVQMEIAYVPSFMTHDEMLRISETLPCVQMVEKDYIKRMQDPVELPEPIQMIHDPRHLHDESDGSDNNCNSLGDCNRVGNPVNEEKQYRHSIDNFVDAPRHLQGTAPQRNNQEINSEGLVFPNDLWFGDQWHLQQSIQWSVQPQKEWAQWRGSSAMVVAIIDSGCDLNHPDLESKKWINTGEVCGDGIDNDQNGYVDDCYGWDWVDNDNNPSPQGSGHGTAAAGIIAASTNNQIGVSGICWDCRIMCLRFIKGAEGRVSNQVAAIDYAAKMGAKISNNSYGGYGFSRLEYEVIKRARSYGHLFVSSAGNNNYNTDLPQYDHTPSIYNLDNIIAVGASTKVGKKASYSNYGRESVDFFAPGSRIVTTEHGGGYSIVSGTSFAAPMGVGAAALVWSRFPMLSYLDVIKALISSCRKSSYMTNLAVCEGVVDIGAGMKAAADLARMKSGGQASEIQLRRESTTSVVPENNNNKPSLTDSGSGASDGHNLTPTALSGYTGWLGAFLSGINRVISRPVGVPDSETSVMIEGARSKKSKPADQAIIVADETQRETTVSSGGASGKASNGVERWINLLASPIGQLQTISSTLKNLIVGGG